MPDMPFGPYVSFISFYFMLFILTIVLRVYYATEKVATMRTGPNNARHIIWVIGEFFSLLFCVF